MSFLAVPSPTAKPRRPRPPREPGPECSGCWGKICGATFPSPCGHQIFHSMCFSQILNQPTRCDGCGQLIALPPLQNIVPSTFLQSLGSREIIDLTGEE